MTSHRIDPKPVKFDPNNPGKLSQSLTELSDIELYEAWKYIKVEAGQLPLRENFSRSVRSRPQNPSNRPGRPGFPVQGELFCVCNRPNDGGAYLQCDSCRKWYHPKCLDLPPNYNPDSFICRECRKNSDDLYRPEDVSPFLANPRRKRKAPSQPKQMKKRKINPSETIFPPHRNSRSQPKDRPRKRKPDLKSRSMYKRHSKKNHSDSDELASESPEPFRDRRRKFNSDLKSESDSDSESFSQQAKYGKGINEYSNVSTADLLKKIVEFEKRRFHFEYQQKVEQVRKEFASAMKSVESDNTDLVAERDRYKNELADERITIDAIKNKMKKEYQIHLNKQLQMQREKFKEKMLMMEHTADISAPNPKVVNRMALKEIQRGMRAEMKEADSNHKQEVSRLKSENKNLKVQLREANKKGSSKSTKALQQKLNDEKDTLNNYKKQYVGIVKENKEHKAEIKRLKDENTKHQVKTKEISKYSIQAGHGSYADQSGNLPTPTHQPTRQATLDQTTRPSNSLPSIHASPIDEIGDKENYVSSSSPPPRTKPNKSKKHTKQAKSPSSKPTPKSSKRRKKKNETGKDTFLGVGELVKENSNLKCRLCASGVQRSRTHIKIITCSKGEDCKAHHEDCAIAFHYRCIRMARATVPDEESWMCSTCVSRDN